MITRQQYLNKEATHRQFYAQFVNTYIKKSVLQSIGLEKLKAAAYDEHLNSIALSYWDSMAHYARISSVCNKMKECGDFLTLSGCVCILKEAARQVIEENK